MTAPRPHFTAGPRAGRPQVVDLQIGGMTCASCAIRIEKKLNRMRRRHRDGQLRHREGAGHVRRRRDDRRPGRHGGADRLHGRGCRRRQQPAATTRPRDGADIGTAEVRDLRRRVLVSAAPHRARGAAGDGPRAAVRLLAVAVAHPCGAGRHLGRLAVPPRGAGPTCGTAPRPWTPWCRSASSPRSAGRCTRCSSAAPARSACRCRSRWCRRAGPAPTRSTSRSRPGSRCSCCVGRYLEARARRRSRRRPARSAVDGRQGRRGAARRAARCGSPVTELAVGDEFVVRPGEKVATDGNVVARHLGRRRVDAHRRAGARRGRPWRRRGRRDGQRRRPARRAGHPGRAATPSSRRWPGWWRTAQSGKAEVQRLADRVSGGLRASGHRARRRHPRVLARHRRAAGARVQRGGRGADHRLPVRAGPGDADGAARRHRPRRAARHPHQGSRGARADPPRRHRACSTRRARSPPGRMQLVDVVPADGVDRGGTCCGSPARSSTPASTRSPPPSRRPHVSEVGALPAVRRVPSLEGLGVQGVVAGADGATHAVVVGRPRAAGASGRSRCRRSSPPHCGRTRRRAAPSSPSAGTARPAGWWSSPTPSSRPAPRQWHS